VLSAPRRTVEVVADTGARITEFSLDGVNVLATPNDDAYSYGVTFWPSPQKPWGWPPPEEIDIGPYTGLQKGDVVTLTSAPSPRVGLTLTKAVRLDPATGVVHVDYTMHNVRDTPVEVAPWENVRVRPEGITFFPIDGRPAPGSKLKFSVQHGIAVYAHRLERPAVGEKGFANGKGGWLAHVDHPFGGNGRILILQFEDVPREAQAPGEGEIELYVDGNNKFVEVEHQGRFGKIAPNESVTWSVQWRLERLPADVSASDASALAAFVDKTLGKP
jgi:hypothetical protein